MALFTGLLLIIVSGTAMTVAILQRQRRRLRFAQRRPGIYVASMLVGTAMFVTGFYLVLTSQP